MNPDTEATPSVSADEQVSARIRWSQRGYVLLAGVFVICVAIQVFIAGMAVFVNPARWSLHTSFVHVFNILVLIMLVLAFIGRLPRDLKVAPVGVFALLFIQLITGGIIGRGSIVAAVHPVNALVIFWLTVVIFRRSWRVVAGPVGAVS